MATKKRTKKRRPASRHLSTPRKTTRRRTTRRASPKKRKRRGLSSNSPNAKMTPMKAVKNMGGGAVGGMMYTAPQFMFKMPWYAKLGWTLVGAVGMNYAKCPNVASGQVGAFTFDMIKTLAGSMLKDDMDDAEYVDADTLSDSAFVDQKGNAILQDDQGNLYALNDAGELECMGDAFSLQDYDDSMQSVSMLPLSNNDPYALAGNNPFQLN